MTNREELLARFAERRASMTPEERGDANRRLIRAIFEPIEDDFEHMPIEEVDAYLIEAGIDPVALVERMRVRLAEIRARMDAEVSPNG